MTKGKALAALVAFGLCMVALFAMRAPVSPPDTSEPSAERAPSARRSRSQGSALPSMPTAPRPVVSTGPTGSGAHLGDGGVAFASPSDLGEAGVPADPSPPPPAVRTPEEEAALAPRVTRHRPPTDEERFAIATGMHDFVVIRREEVRAEIRALEASNPRAAQLPRMRRMLQGLDAIEPDVRQRADAVAAELRARPSTPSEPAEAPSPPGE